MSFILGVAHAGPVFAQIESRRAIFNNFTDFFSELQCDNTNYKY